MTTSARHKQRLLAAGFLVIVLGVPLAQAAVELLRREPVQATDLFRDPPTVRNLRQFERTLEDKWWGQTTVRPVTQELLFFALGDTGAKAIAGRDNWLFYRPGLRYLIEPDRPEVDHGDGMWVGSVASRTRRENVVRAIVAYRDQLKRRGIQLLVVPVPGKASVYPEMLSRRVHDTTHPFHSPTEQLLLDLHHKGVATVDLFRAFRQARRSVPNSPVAAAYYLARDTHWTPLGAKVAAHAVAQRLRELGWVPEHRYEYSASTGSIIRFGDILAMMQMPGLRDHYPPECVNYQQVRDQLAGLLMPRAGGRDGRFKNDHLIDTPLESSLLLLGDSYSRIYQTAEPVSLGGGTAYEKNSGPRKRPLPGSAGFPSLLAGDLQAAVDYIVSDGGAATNVRRMLSVDAEMLEHKTVVIWEFAERDIQLGQDGWKPVPLPAD